MIFFKAKRLKKIANKQHKLTHRRKKQIMKGMRMTAQGGGHHYTTSFDYEEEIYDAKTWLVKLGYKVFINNRYIMRISWED